MIEYCFSGGAKGADTVFGIQATNAGHNVIHFSFDGHNTKCKPLILSQEQLLEADLILKAVSKIIKRPFPTRNNYVNNLLRRNFYQIKEAERIYAIADIEDGVINGGTCWAVNMGILQDIRDIYLFDQKTNRWLIYTSLNWIPIKEPPSPHGYYAGIGTRNLTPEGEQAIIDLYNGEQYALY